MRAAPISDVDRRRDAAAKQRISPKLSTHLQQMVRLRCVRRRVVSHQGEQGQGEGAAAREDVALAGAGPVGCNGFVDVSGGLGVVAPQRGQERVSRRQSGAGGFALAQVVGKFFEDRERIVVRSLEGADERNCGHMQRPVGIALAIGFQNRFGRFSRSDDLVKADGERPVNVLLRQCGEHVHDPRPGKPAPLVFADFAQLPPYPVEPPGDGVAAQPHRPVGPVVPAAPVRWELIAVGALDPFKSLVADGLQRQPRRPIPGCDQLAPVSRVVDDARRNDVFAGGLVLPVQDLPTLVPEPGPHEHPGQLSGRQGVRIHDATGHGDQAGGWGQGVIRREEVCHWARTVHPAARQINPTRGHPTLLPGVHGDPVPPAAILPNLMK